MAWLCASTTNKRFSYFRCQYPLQLSIGKESWEKPYELTFRVHSRQFMGRLSRHAMSTIRVLFYAVKPFLLVFTYNKSISLSCGHLSQLRPPFQLLNLHLKLHFTPRIRMSGDRLTRFSYSCLPQHHHPLLERYLDRTKLVYRCMLDRWPIPRWGDAWKALDKRSSLFLKLQESRCMPRWIFYSVRDLVVVYIRPIRQLWPCWSSRSHCPNIALHFISHEQVALLEMSPRWLPKSSRFSEDSVNSTDGRMRKIAARVGFCCNWRYQSHTGCLAFFIYIIEQGGSCSFTKFEHQAINIYLSYIATFKTDLFC